MGLKKILKPSVIIWGVSAVLLAGVLTAGNILAKQYEVVLSGVFGHKRAIVDPNDPGTPFEQECNTKEEAYNNGMAVSKEICEEGMILLKNDNNALPMKSGTKVSIFGKNSVSLVYGGSGSAAPSKEIIARSKTIYDSLEAVGIKCNNALKDFYNNTKLSGEGRSDNPTMADMDKNQSGVATLKTGETPLTSYPDSVKNTYAEYSDAAIMVVSRIAGENFDLPRASDDGAAHYLDLDKNEKALLKDIVDSKKFQRVILLINGSNYVDLGFLKDANCGVDACINIGSPGENGIMALGEILTGKVNPSGHTVDTVYTNYDKDPVWQNFGGNFSKGGDSYLENETKPTSYYYVEYEENIYLGYRYYETRGKDDPTWYSNNVVYPFGYGLSYTTFEQNIVDVAGLEGAALDPTKDFEVSVKVKNTGSVAGKQVVQLYVEAPYTSGGIEKAYKVLCGFGKTKLLEPGKEDTVKITVNPYYFASFDNKDANGNGFKGYELDGGNYIFHAGTDAHTDFGTFTKNLATGYKYEVDPVTGTKVEPLWDECTSYMTESLSRTDWEGTFPHPTTTEERIITADIKAKLRSKETTNNEVFDAVPTMGADKGVSFRDLVGKDYDDPTWNDFLDQMKFEEMLKLFNEGCYSTTDIERLGVPKTTSADGPTGFVAFQGDPAVYGCVYYQSECLLSQTYNLELAKKQANAFGNESLVGNEKGDGLSYPGWYAPGVNLHRSPFSGRNTEYYAEDPLLTGKFAATVIKGVQEKGVYANVKHFALNDQETHRGGIATWCDEQAMRELYFKAFEIAVKEGKSHGLMTSFNRIGYEWAGGSYRLVTTVLRKEWGFVGSVICDYKSWAFMDSKQMLYAGGDLSLVAGADGMLQAGKNPYGTAYVTETDPKDTNMLRRTAHNNLYALVNSNAMKANILGYKEAYWVIGLNVGTAVVAVGTAAWGAAVIFLALRKKPTPAAAE